jgi:hypothetical protein
MIINQTSNNFFSQARTPLYQVHFAPCNASINKMGQKDWESASSLWFAHLRKVVFLRGSLVRPAYFRLTELMTNPLKNQLKWICSGVKPFRNRRHPEPALPGYPADHAL